MAAANPKNSSAVSLLARADAREGRVEEAVAALRAGVAARAAGEREQMTLLAQLAQVQADALRYNEAVATYDELLRARGVGEEQVSPDKKNLVGIVLGRVIDLRRQAGQADEARAAVGVCVACSGATTRRPTLKRRTPAPLGRRSEAPTRLARRRTPPRSPSFAGSKPGRSATSAGRRRSPILRARLKGTPDDFGDYLASPASDRAGRGTEAVEAARKPRTRLSRPAARTARALAVLASAQQQPGT